MNSWSVVTRPGWNLCQLSGSAFGLDLECPVTTRPWSTHLTRHQGKVRLPLWHVLNIILRRIRAAAPTTEDKLPNLLVNILRHKKCLGGDSWTELTGPEQPYQQTNQGFCLSMLAFVTLPVIWYQLTNSCPHNCVTSTNVSSRVRVRVSAKSQLLWSLSTMSKYVSILYSSHFNWRLCERLTDKTYSNSEDKWSFSFTQYLTLETTWNDQMQC